MGPLLEIARLYAGPQHADHFHTVYVASEAILAALGGQSMHEPASEVLRISLPRNRVNRLVVISCAGSAGLAHSSEKEHQANHRHQQAQERYAQKLDNGSAPDAREGVP